MFFTLAPISKQKGAKSLSWASSFEVNSAQDSNLAPLIRRMELKWKTFWDEATFIQWINFKMEISDWIKKKIDLVLFCFCFFKSNIFLKSNEISYSVHYEILLVLLLSFQHFSLLILESIHDWRQVTVPLLDSWFHFRGFQAYFQALRWTFQQVGRQHYQLLRQVLEFDKIHFNFKKQQCSDTW